MKFFAPGLEEAQVTLLDRRSQLLPKNHELPLGQIWRCNLYLKDKRLGLVVMDEVYQRFGIVI